MGASRQQDGNNVVVCIYQWIIFPISAMGSIIHASALRVTDAQPPQNCSRVYLKEYSHVSEHTYVYAWPFGILAA